MIKKYITLFQINLQHSFYADGKARDLILEPSPATQQIMRQFDLRWIAQKDVYYMVYGHEEGSAAKLSFLEPDARMSFYLRSTNPYFINFTALPFFNPGAQLLYFDNLAATDRAGVLGKAAAVSENDLLPIHQSPFKVNNLVGLRNGNNQVLNQEGEGATALWALVDMEDESRDFQINLQNYPPDKYGFDIVTGDTNWFFHPGPGLKAGDLGFVNIFFGNSPNMLALPPKSNEPELPNGAAAWPAKESKFIISFESRETIWRYNIINSNPDDTMMIDDGPIFMKGDKYVLRDGTHEAIPFISNTSLKLQERPSIKPKLYIQKSQSNLSPNGGSISIDLPSPDYQNLTPEKDGSVFSDMYIFL